MPGELPFNARVFIANFGKENYLWPECLSTPCIATLDDEDLRDYWMTGNRRGYIEHCLRTKLTVRGLKPNRALASRWFNVHTTLSESSGDIWIHREKDDLWWAISGSQPITEDVRPPYKALPSAPNSIVRRKQTTPWSNKDLTGRRLSWKTLHPKAQTFFLPREHCSKLATITAMPTIHWLRCRERIFRLGTGQQIGGFLKHGVAFLGAQY